MQGGSPLQAPLASRLPDGLSAEQLRRSLEGIPSTLQGMRSPLGEPIRSESVAGMDMLNDMFQRQARRLESQLYQRAQDLRTIEMTQRQAALARAQVRQLEQHHLEQAARISQGSKSLQRLQELIRESIQSNNSALGLCEAYEHEVSEMRAYLQREAPAALASFTRRSDDSSTVMELRQRVASLENALAETERSAMQQIGVTPLQSVAMSSDCNPLHDLSAVADYATKASVGATGAPQGRSASVSIEPPQPPPPPPPAGAQYGGHHLDAAYPEASPAPSGIASALSLPSAAAAAAQAAMAARGMGAPLGDGGVIPMQMSPTTASLGTGGLSLLGSLSGGVEHLGSSGGSGSALSPRPASAGCGVGGYGAAAPMAMQTRRR